MPQRLNIESEPEIYHVWDVHEYTKYPHSKRWYLVAGLLLLACVVYALVADNYFFAIILILIAFIFAYHEMREPEVTQFAVADRGIVWRGFLFPYKDIKKFWVIYDSEQDVKNLYFTFKRSTSPRLCIPLEDQDPVEIRATLSQFVKEDLTQDDEPLSDAVGRVLKF